MDKYMTLRNIYADFAKEITKINLYDEEDSMGLSPFGTLLYNWAIGDTQEWQFGYDLLKINKEERFLYLTLLSLEREEEIMFLGAIAFGLIKCYNIFNYQTMISIITALAIEDPKRINEINNLIEFLKETENKLFPVSKSNVEEEEWDK